MTDTNSVLLDVKTRISTEASEIVRQLDSIIEKAEKDSTIKVKLKLDDTQLDYLKSLKNNIKVISDAFGKLNSSSSDFAKSFQQAMKNLASGTINVKNDLEEISNKFTSFKGKVNLFTGLADSTKELEEAKNSYDSFLKSFKDANEKGSANKLITPYIKLLNTIYEINTAINNGIGNKALLSNQMNLIGSVVKQIDSVGNKSFSSQIGTKMSEWLKGIDIKNVTAQFNALAGNPIKQTTSDANEMSKALQSLMELLSQFNSIFVNKDGNSYFESLSNSIQSLSDVFTSTQENFKSNNSILNKIGNSSKKAAEGINTFREANVGILEDINLVVESLRNEKELFEALIKLTAVTSASKPASDPQKLAQQEQLNKLLSQYETFSNLYSKAIEGSTTGKIDLSEIQEYSQKLDEIKDKIKELGSKDFKLTSDENIQEIKTISDQISVLFNELNNIKEVAGIYDEAITAVEKYYSVVATNREKGKETDKERTAYIRMEQALIRLANARSKNIELLVLEEKYENVEQAGISKVDAATKYYEEQQEIKKTKTDISELEKAYKSLNSEKNKKNKPISYYTDLEQLKTIINEINSQKIDINTADGRAAIGALIKDGNTLVNTMRDAETLATALEKAVLSADISKYMNDNTRAGRQSIVMLQSLVDRLRDVGLTKTEFQKIQTEFNQLKTRIEEAGKAGQSFIDIFKQRVVREFAQQLSFYFGFRQIVRYIREAVTTITELDTALIDLKKTTAMTASELNDFYMSSGNLAKETGVTTKEIIEQAAGWSRLGYNSKEASEQMAQLSSQFAQISPGMETDKATEGLVSIMKAFDMEVDDVKDGIMSKINIIGNKMAVTNLDIVEGLERSSAAMSALGQSFEDTVALFSAGSEVLQNAQTAGTALRTMALRIRGYDEETEQLSEDLVDVTGKVANLTKTASSPNGISLFTDTTQTHYKSMVDYLRELSQIWDDISEKDQTQLIELLFGKRGAQLGSAILKNFDRVDYALQNMEESAGNADEEFGIIQESISYKMNAFKQTWIQTLQELVNNGSLGKLVDSLTTISETLGKIAKLGGLSGVFGLGLGGWLGGKNAGRGEMLPFIYCSNMPAIVSVL